MASINVSAILGNRRITGIMNELPERMETKQAINGDGKPAAIEYSMKQDYKIKISNIKANQLRQGNGAGSPFPDLFGARQDKNPEFQLTLIFDTHTETFPKAKILTDKFATLKGTGEDLEIEIAVLSALI
jgi:hypothetical protein